jgi:soluble lytic murein transglycosylase-like protein
MDARDRYDSLLRWYSDLQQIPFALAKAQMLAESAANPRAVSPVGAEGLLQFMPATFQELGGGDPFNPETAIAYGAKYLRQLLDQFGGFEDAALAAYNWGRGHLRQLLREHPTDWRDHLPAETRAYLRRIAELRADHVP